MSLSYSINGASNKMERVNTLLEMFVLLARYYNATDPRDQIFAPFALVSSLLPSYPNITNQVFPDYHSGQGQELTRFIVLFSKILPILPYLHILKDTLKSFERDLF